LRFYLHLGPPSCHPFSLSQYGYEAKNIPNPFLAIPIQIAVFEKKKKTKKAHRKKAGMYTRARIKQLQLWYNPLPPT
jgi:hypothetical protein